jgi:Epoxide hydrolase N terminus
VQKSNLIAFSIIDEHLTILGPDCVTRVGRKLSSLTTGASAPLKWIREICGYWAYEYKWRQREARLNYFAQFTTEIDGLDMHFLHVRSPHPDATPLIITHGWPGSVIEFHKVIEPLTDPTAHGDNAADAFHVVCQSLPGFGFSAKPTTTLGCRPHCVELGGVDGSPRIIALWRTGWRLGIGDHHGDRRGARRTLRRHSHYAGNVRPPQC